MALKAEFLKSKTGRFLFVATIGLSLGFFANAVDARDGDIEAGDGASAQDGLKALYDAASSLQTRLQTLELDARRKDILIDSLQKTVEAKRGVENENIQLKQRLQEYDNAQRLSAAKIQELQGMNEKYLAEMKKLADDIERGQKELEAQAKALGEAKVTAESQKAEAEKQKAQSLLDRDSLTKANADVAQLQKQLDAQAKALSEARSDSAELESELQKVKAQGESELEKVKTQSERERDDIKKEQERKIAEHLATVSTVKMANETLQSEFRRQKELNEKMQDEINRLKSEISQKESRVAEAESIKAENRKMESEMKKMNGEIAVRAKKLSEQIEASEDIKARLEGLKRERSEWDLQREKLHNEIKAKAMTIERSEEMLQGLERKVKQAEEELKMARGQSAALEKKLVEEARNRDRLAAESTKKLTVNLEFANKKIQDLAKETAVAHYNLGVLFMRQGQYKEAAGEFEYTVSLNPIDAFAHFNLAVLYDNYLDDPDRAVRHYEHYIRLLPDAGDAKKVEYRLFQIRLNEEAGIGEDLKASVKKLK